MTDHPIVPDGDLTQPARQGEVPDWITSSEESSPVVADEPDKPDESGVTDGKPAVAEQSSVSPDEASDTESEDSAEPADSEETEEVEEAEDSEVRRPVPPVGTRRQRASIVTPTSVQSGAGRRPGLVLSG